MTDPEDIIPADAEGIVQFGVYDGDGHSVFIQDAQHDAAWLQIDADSMAELQDNEWTEEAEE